MVGTLPLLLRAGTQCWQVDIHRWWVGSQVWDMEGTRAVVVDIQWTEAGSLVVVGILPEDSVVNEWDRASFVAA